MKRLISCFMLVLFITLVPGSAQPSSPATEKDPERQVQQLRESFSLFPYDPAIKKSLVIALKTVGTQQMEQKKFDRAAESFGEAASLLPDDPEPGFLRGVALYKAKRYDEAAYELEKTGQVTGEDAMVLFYQGLIRYETGDVAGSLQLWDRSLVLDPQNRQVRFFAEKARRELTVEGTMGKGYRSMFVVSYDEGTMAPVAENVLETLEEAYSTVGSKLDHYPSVKIPVILYTRTDYRNITSGPAWSAGLYDGKIRLPIGGAVKVEGVLRSVLFHEYAHVVVKEITGGNCPTWLNEGIAEVIARMDTPSLAVLQAAAADGSLFPASSLEKSVLGLDGKQAQLAYLQSYSMVEHLITTYGWHKLKDILVNLGSGMNPESAFASGLADFGLTYAGFVKEWQDELRK